MINKKRKGYFLVVYVVLKDIKVWLLGAGLNVKVAGVFCVPIRSYAQGFFIGNQRYILRRQWGNFSNSSFELNPRDKVCSQRTLG